MYDRNCVISVAQLTLVMKFKLTTVLTAYNNKFEIQLKFLTQI